MNGLRAAMLGGLLAVLGFGGAQAEDIDVRTAHERVETGQTQLIDVRTPPEWAQTGAPADAARINLYDENGPNGFVAKVLEELGGDRDAPVALICRTGARSTHAAKLLRQAGFTNVANVEGGVVGSFNATGWFDAGLPVAP